MASDSRSTSFQALSAYFFLAFVAAVSYIAYLHLAGKELDFYTNYITTPFFATPDFAMSAIKGGGVWATATVAGVISLHLFAAAIGAAIIAAFAYKLFSNENNKIVRHDQMENACYLLPQSKEARIVISIFVEDLKNVSGATRKTQYSVFPETYLRLDRAKLAFNRPVKNPVEGLERALWEILYAHKEWPADPHGHHANVPLYEHAQRVAKKMLESTHGHPLARILGLAHDIGKIMAYEQIMVTRKVDADGEAIKEAKWHIKTKQHDKLSAHIVRMLPEFHLLTAEQQNTIDVVLAYSHKPDKTPKRRTTPQEITLLRHLRTVDGLATNEDQAQIGDLVTDIKVMSELRDALRRLIPQLNINEVRPGYADGWTSDIHDYVAIKEQSIRHSLDGYLNPKLTMTLGLKNDTGNHPTLPLIKQALRDIGYLMESYAGHSPENLFSVKVGKVDFDWIFLLSRQSLEKDAKEIVESWGDSKYQIKVRVNREAKSPSVLSEKNTPSQPG